MKINWVHYLSRPFSLFGASVWHEWYSSSLAKKYLGINLPNSFFVENPKGVVRYYRDQVMLHNVNETVKNIIVKQPELYKKLLAEGLTLNKIAKQHLKQNRFHRLEEGLHFLVRMAMHSTILPHLAGEHGSKDRHMMNMASELRKRSYYPIFMEKVIIPLAMKRLNMKVKEQDIHLLTLQEIYKKDLSKLSARRQARKLQKVFIYETVNAIETISWEVSTDALVNRLEDHHGNSMEMVKGSVATKGYVKGIARLVLSNAAKGVQFQKNDILIAVHTSPNLLPLMKKAAAIVTDDGGVLSHAAVLSRELKKPCVIGTKHATKIFKDGDFVLVDARKGFVRKVRSFA